jgi:hypothetical protein
MSLSIMINIKHFMISVIILIVAIMSIMLSVVILNVVAPNSILVVAKPNPRPWIEAPLVTVSGKLQGLLLTQWRLNWTRLSRSTISIPVVVRHPCVTRFYKWPLRPINVLQG